MANSIANDKKMALFFFFKHDQRGNVFPTARLTSPKKASRQVATSVVPRAEGVLQIPTISHHRNFYFHRRGQEQTSPSLNTLQSFSSSPQTVNLVSN